MTATATGATSGGSQHPTWRSLVGRATDRLGDPTLARRLVEEVSGQGAARLATSLDDPAPDLAVMRCDALASRLAAGEPLQYVLGHWGFRTLDLVVRPNALVPRPETEVVVEAALGELGTLGGQRVVDLGTGTGAIALSIAVEARDSEVFATDRSHGALELASANLAGLGTGVAARVRLLAGDWYSALPEALAGTVDLVVSNPPYVAEHEWRGLEPVVREHEPRDALVAGPTGLEAIEAVLTGAPGWLASTASVVVEIGSTQARRALSLAAGAGFAAARVLPDLAGRDRVLVARR